MLSTNPIQHARTKDVGHNLYFVGEKVIQGQLVVKHMPYNLLESDQITDILTDIIFSTRFHTLRSKIKKLSYPHSEFKEEC